MTKPTKAKTLKQDEDQEPTKRHEIKWVSGDNHASISFHPRTNDPLAKRISTKEHPLAIADALAKAANWIREDYYDEVSDEFPEIEKYDDEFSDPETR